MRAFAFSTSLGTVELLLKKRFESFLMRLSERKLFGEDFGDQENLLSPVPIIATKATCFRQS